MSTKDLKEKGTHFLLLTGSTLLMAVGTYFFKFTNNFTFGGITGLAVLIAKTGVMSAGDFNLIASMILLLIGMIILGRKFAATTAYCSILLSVTLSLLERICPMTQPLTDQPMLELCFAIALPALGSAVLFNIGSSSGGTDIIAMILKKYSSFDIGHALLASDILITIAGFFVFDSRGPRPGAPRDGGRFSISCVSRCLSSSICIFSSISFSCFSALEAVSR